VDIETGEVIKNSIQGQANVYSYLEENTDVLERIEKKIDEFITMN
jgi:3-dehydroquinate synthetase